MATAVTGVGVMSRRVQLSWKEKRTASDEFRRRNVHGGSNAIAEVAEWALHTLHLAKVPCFHTVLRILRDHNCVLMKSDSSHVHMKADLFVTSTAIENHMVQWVWWMSYAEVFLSENMIIEKERRVQLPVAERTNLQLANGGFIVFSWEWVYDVPQSWIKCAISDELSLLHAILSAFELKDIFNADEFDIFYRAAPTTTIGLRRLHGEKKKKDCITFLACTNADGCDRVATLTIGTSMKLRCFGGRFGNEHRLYCTPVA